MKKLYTIAAALLIAASSHAQVVISQVFGGGGNAGSVYTHDFVELFNRGSEAVTLTGHTLQYASNTGAFNSKQTLPTITIQPGKYYLIQQAQGNGGTTPLPTPDLVTNTTDHVVVLAMGGSNGKIVLASNTTTVTSPTDANVVDYVGFGTATAFEGTGPTAAISATTSAMRVNNGCQDTNNNANDFVATTVTPRNGATAPNVCGTASTKNFDTISGLKLFPNPLSGTVLNITSNSNADKTVAIFDVLGKNVLNAKVSNETVNVAALTSGVYIVKVTEEGKTATRKLVVK